MRKVRVQLAAAAADCMQATINKIDQAAFGHADTMERCLINVWQVTMVECRQAQGWSYTGR